MNMEKCDYGGSWYHGSPERLNVLQKGSWVTPFKELAKAFSHQPSLISSGDNYETVKHNGQRPGFLFMVCEVLSPDDVSYLPNTAQTHWQTNRDLRLRLMSALPVNDPPQLNEEEIAILRKDMPESTTGFFSTPDMD